VAACAIRSPRDFSYLKLIANGIMRSMPPGVVCTAHNGGLSGRLCDLFIPGISAI
jgi:hypothetical protein